MRTVWDNRVCSFLDSILDHISHQIMVFAGVNWALIRCTPPPEVPRPFEPGTSLSSSTLSEDTSVTRGAKVTSGQDSLNVSSNALSGHKFDSDSSLKAGEKSNSNRSATQSTQSSGGSYLDFDFF